jgi:hypothetical protein
MCDRHTDANFGSAMGIYSWISIRIRASKRLSDKVFPEWCGRIARVLASVRTCGLLRGPPSAGRARAAIHGVKWAASLLAAGEPLLVELDDTFGCPLKLVGCVYRWHR